MAWCEEHGVRYVFGFAPNERLRRWIEPQMQQAAQQRCETKQSARVFTEFLYETTTGSWSRARRVIAKAEYLEKGENPRYVVTSLNTESWPAQALYEELYCARVEMENRIKEQFSLFAARECRDAARQSSAFVFLSPRLCSDARFAAVAIP